MSVRSLRNLSAGLAIASLALSPVAAQPVQEIDPNSAIQADLGTPPAAATGYGSQSELPPVQDSAPVSVPAPPPPQGAPAPQGTAAAAVAARGLEATPVSDTFQDDDLIGAAEGVFGKGAKGLAEMIESILRKQGRPNAYISGREGGGAFVFGLRYGSGTMFHKIEGQRPVYWTGPSIGFDAGANAGSTFILVYNLYDSADLYHRFPAGEGAAYMVGGFNASYVRRGDVVLIPIRMGVGARLGINAGYLKFSRKQNWMPF